MSNPSFTTEQVIDYVARGITPLFKVERTMVMPFDLDRHENYGEHDISLGLLAGSLAGYIDPSLDTGKIVEYAAVHDIAHIYHDDVTVWEPDEVIRQRARDEELVVDRIQQDFSMFPWVIKRYREYRQWDTPEKRFVYALDKLIPHILIVIEDHHPIHPTWEAYERTEQVARASVEYFPALLPLFNELCAVFRSKSHFFSSPIPADERAKAVKVEDVVISKDVLRLVDKVIMPLFKVERTMVMTFDHNRHENDGEHSLAVGLLAGALAEHIDPSLDTGRLVEYALTHDIVEVLAGDVSVWASDKDLDQKAKNEAAAAKQIAADFPMFPWLMQKYNEYEQKDGPEQRFIYALDKIYPHLLILAGDHHPVRPSWKAYLQKEKVARVKVKAFPGLMPLFDDLCNMFRDNPHFFATPIPSSDQQQTGVRRDPWPHNPLVTLIRQHSTKIISEVIDNYENEHGFRASAFDLVIQVMIVACSYKPAVIWQAKNNDIHIAAELVTKGAPSMAHDVLEASIELGSVQLNENVIKRITKQQLTRLHSLYLAHKNEFDLPNIRDRVSAHFEPDAELSMLQLSDGDGQSSIYKAIATEKISKQKVEFRPVDMNLSKAYVESFHYLHTARDDDEWAFGAFIEGETVPFALVTYAPSYRKYKQKMLQLAGMNPQQSVELTRAWNSELSPKNTMSMLYAYAHANIQQMMLQKMKVKELVVLTAVNPNLGFKGSAFRAVGFGVIGEKPTKYHYLIDGEGRRWFTVRRSLSALARHPKKHPINVTTSLFPLLPTKEMAVILNGSRRLQPAVVAYSVSETEYRQEVPQLSELK